MSIKINIVKLILKVLRINPYSSDRKVRRLNYFRLVRFELTLFYTQSKCLTRLGYNLIINIIITIFYFLNYFFYNKILVLK